MTKVIGFAWFEPEQWRKLQSALSGTTGSEGAYGEWVKRARREMEVHTAAGYDVRKVNIDVDEYLEWCRYKGVPASAAAQDQFATYKLYTESRRN
jgi:hypothetical protein